jgi:carnitine 3-dehydrogenase
MRNKNNTITATGEHMLIHVSLTTRSACEPTADIKTKLSAILKRHSKLPSPNGLGQSVNGQTK